MRKIYCELHLFDLHQKIYMIDTDVGMTNEIGAATMEELPECISAISNETGCRKVLLSGNSVLGMALAEDIVAYSKKNYNWNDHDIEVEVLK